MFWALSATVTVLPSADTAVMVKTSFWLSIRSRQMVVVTKICWPGCQSTASWSLMDVVPTSRVEARRVQVGLYRMPCMSIVPPGRTRIPKANVLIPLAMRNWKVMRDCRRQVSDPAVSLPYTSMEPKFHTMVLSSMTSCKRLAG